MMDICIFGDSVSKGVIYDQVRDRYSFLKTSFAHLLEHDKNNVYLHAKFGCTTDQGKLIVEKNPEDVSRSEFTLLEFGGNDSDFDWQKISDSPDSFHKPHTDLSDFKNNYTTIINDVKKYGGKPVIMNLHPIDQNKYFDRITRTLSKENILKWLKGDIDYIYTFHEKYNNAVEELALSLGLPIINIHDVFLNYGNYSELLCDDGIHPNEKGHKIIYGAVSSFFCSY